MKKIFLFAAAALAALSVNAKVYDFSTITASDIVTSASVSEEVNDEGKPTGKLLIAVPGDQSIVNVTLFEDIKLKYNSDKAANIVIDTKNGYFEFPGNGKTQEGKSLVIVEGVTIGEFVTFEGANKSKDNLNSIVAKEGAEGSDVSMPKKSSNGDYTWVEATFKATEGTVTISAPSCRIRKISTGSDAQGIESIQADKKAIKRFENGQLIIIKNGVKYNAIGVKL